MQTMFGVWAPPLERSFLFTIAFIGTIYLIVNLSQTDLPYYPVIYYTIYLYAYNRLMTESSMEMR